LGRPFEVINLGSRRHAVRTPSIGLSRRLEPRLVEVSVVLRIRDISALEIPVIAATPEILIRLASLSCRATTYFTVRSRRIEFTSLTLKPQSTAKPDSEERIFLRAVLEARSVVTALARFVYGRGGVYPFSRKTFLQDFLLPATLSYKINETGNSASSQYVPP
jgi:hypothetical protein